MSSIVSAIVGSPTRQLTEEETHIPDIDLRIPDIDLRPEISDLDNLTHHTPRATPLDRQIERMLSSKPATLSESQQRYWSDKDRQSIEKNMNRLQTEITALEQAAITIKALEKESKRLSASRGMKPLTLGSRVALGAAQGVLRGIAGSNHVKLNQLAEIKREAEQQQHTPRTGGMKTKKTLKKYKGSILVHRGKLDKFNKCSSRSCHKNKIRRTKRRRGTKRRRR
jgi:outer membrane translocation and assembly module TamA